jgi:glutamate N-acetyltransferase/amino-acid N-acetyltransferase
METTERGVCLRGFLAGGWRKGKDGVAVLLSEREASCGLLLTTNQVQGAPLTVSREHRRKGRVRGVVVNSGNANTLTGERGVRDARRMCEIAARTTGHKPENFLVASTGVIGRRLEMEIVEEGIQKAVEALRSSTEASLEAARAIMTTDRFPKSVSVRIALEDGTPVEIGGIAKGAGMIGPQLAQGTMLAFLTTDAHVPPGEIQGILQEAADQSFNRTLVEGDMSTSDMVVLLANGTAGNRRVDEAFREGLYHVTRELARKVARDGEGATKLLEIRVTRGRNEGEAEEIARSIARSPLVKTAFFGRDPNWGRILAAAGASRGRVDPEKVTLTLRSGDREVPLVEGGEVLAFQGSAELEKAERLLHGEEILVLLDLSLGEGSATVYTCDLSYDYVKINAEYTT